MIGTFESSPRSCLSACSPSITGMCRSIGTAAQHHHDALGAVLGRLDLVVQPVTEAVEELRQHLPDRLLIVDDEDTLRRSLERLVGAFRYARHGPISSREQSKCHGMPMGDW